MSGALDGMRVIDLSRVLAAPLCGQMLADHGADVIKIEPPKGDECRDWGPPFQGDAAAYFVGANRNKRGLALDLSKAEGRDILLKLVAQADVLIENFRPGTMERWDLGYDELAKRFPRLIYASLTGFGADGPLGGLPGYDLFIQGETGLVSVNGSPESGPVRIAVPVVDILSAHNLTIGVLLALNARQKTGNGQHVDVSLYDTGISLLHPHAANWFMTGETPKLVGNMHATIAPYGLFNLNGSLLFIGAGNTKAWSSLCRVLGLQDIESDPRFESNASRVANRAELDALIENSVNDKDGEEIARRLNEAGVACGIVRTVDHALQHPHTLHREMRLQFQGREMLGIPVKLSDTPGNVNRLPPAFNQDAEEILGEIGLQAEARHELEEMGAVVRERQRPKRKQ